MTTKEERSEKQIDALLQAAGWSVQAYSDCNPSRSVGVAIKAFPLARGYGVIDYLLHLEGKAVGFIETRPPGVVLTGVAVDAEKYSRGLPFSLRLFTRPLPFLYQSSGAETRFTNAFDPDPKPRYVFAFHRPETLKIWLEDGMLGEATRDMAAEAFPEYRRRGRSFHERILINMPPIVTQGLLSVQIKAIQDIETALRKNRSRILIEMAAGSEKHVTIFRLMDRLIRFADANRILLLVDDDNIGNQVLRKVRQYISPHDTVFFTDALMLRPPGENSFTPDTRIWISTVQSLEKLLEKNDLPEAKTGERAIKIQYNAAFPIETFDLVLIDECRFSSCLNWRNILEYFDAKRICFTENPDQQSRDFFDQNQGIDYRDGQEISDGLNVISNL